MQGKHYLFDLGFGANAIALGPVFRRRVWVTCCYLVFCIGIMARELSMFPKMALVETLPDWRVPAAAFVVGLAMFPPVIRWVSRRKAGVPTPEHFFWCFSFGFFWSFVADATVPMIQAALGK